MLLLIIEHRAGTAKTVSVAEQAISQSADGLESAVNSTLDSYDCSSS